MHVVCDNTTDTVLPIANLSVFCHKVVLSLNSLLLYVEQKEPLGSDNLISVQFPLHLHYEIKMFSAPVV